MAFPTISPLTSSNWYTWKKDIKMLLIYFDCWKFIEDTKKPEGDISSVSDESTTEKATTKTESSPKLSYREKLDYKLRKNRAFTLIYKNVSNEFKPLISLATDGSEAWNILKERFEPRTIAHAIQLHNEFFESRYIPGEDAVLFVCRVKAAAERLREIGHAVNDFLLCLQLIRSLPEEFQDSVRQMFRWPDEDFTPSKIEAEIILQRNILKFMPMNFNTGKVPFNEKQQTCETFQHDCPRRNTKKPVSKSCAREHTSRPPHIGSTNFLSKPSGNSKVGPCFKCKKFGHIAAQCKAKMNKVIIF